MLFAKSIILVEGITEALLVPVLARRMNLHLDQHGVAVVPVCGVDFETITRLFGEKGLQIRVAIVTDGDAGTERAANGNEVEWEKRRPKTDDSGKLAICSRVLNLLETYKAGEFVGVFHSNVTLEYSLADAGANNPSIICAAWESLFQGTPRTLNQKKLTECRGIHAEEVLTIWRGICLADATCSKAEFAQALAARLEARDRHGNYVVPAALFAIPGYLQEAFNHVIPSRREAAD